MKIAGIDCSRSSAASLDLLQQTRDGHVDGCGVLHVGPYPSAQAIAGWMAEIQGLRVTEVNLGALPPDALLRFALAGIDAEMAREKFVCVIRGIDDPTQAEIVLQYLDRRVLHGPHIFTCRPYDSRYLLAGQEDCLDAVVRTVEATDGGIDESFSKKDEIDLSSESSVR